MRPPHAALVLALLGARSHAQPAPRSACPALARPDRDGRFVAREDLRGPVAPVAGDDWLALVNRSPRGALAPDYAPRDLVDLRTLAPAAPATCVPPDRQCLRREAALALRELTRALRAATGDALVVDSAFRGHAIQCQVFGKWAWREGRGFCPTAVASALPGHSQHQLGTALDAFSARWLREGYRFREGFGCTPAGRWLAEQAWTFGFVVPYPLHPDHRAPGSDCLARPDARDRIDPRTGYKHEPWHLRYLGRAHAARFHAAWAASGPGTAAEITLEQWIRRERGLSAPIDPPVCDGCACDGCATFRRRDATTRTPCPAGEGVVTYDPATGEPLAPRADPTLRAARAEADGGGLVVRATVEVPEDTWTQPPVVTAASGVRYGRGATVDALVGVRGGLVRSYPDAPGAVRLAVRRAGEVGWPWRAALVSSRRDATSNGFDARIPASAGTIELAVPIEGVTAGEALVVALLREGRALGQATTLRAP